jgi:hypothetical protein
MRPALEQPVRPRRTLEPTEEHLPEIRKAQEVLWQQLRTFASDVKLSDAQWEQFERDLSELGAMDAVAFYGQALRTRDFEGVVELSEELELELEQRAATYMTKKQLDTLRFRFGDLVTRVRQLHYVPRTLEDLEALTGGRQSM